jgi:hypothetical protein
VTGHRTENRRDATGISDEADGQPVDEQDVGSDEPRSRAAAALELDLAGLDDDQPVAPLRVEDRLLRARRDHDDVALEALPSEGVDAETIIGGTPRQ